MPVGKNITLGTKKNPVPEYIQGVSHYGLTHYKIGAPRKI